MRRKPGFTAIVLLVALLVSQEFEPLLSAQTAIPTPQQLDQLLAPVALYPDSLLAQITTASTNPQEILDVDNWLQQNSGLTGAALTDAAEKQGFDPAFIALTTFPQVLDMMAQNVDDYAAIGQAFLADQALVTASIQRLRAQAYAAGTLQSNPQQQVEVQQTPSQTIYVIQPANPQVVYVPVYNPTVVYVRPTTSTVVVTSLITFGAGIAIGALLVGNQPWGWNGWGWGWGSHRCYYNHTVWVRWEIRIGRRTFGIVLDQFCIPAVRDITATGTIDRRTTGLQCPDLVLPIVRPGDRTIGRAIVLLRSVRILAGRHSRSLSRTRPNHRARPSRRLRPSRQQMGRPGRQLRGLRRKPSPHLKPSPHRRSRRNRKLDRRGRVSLRLPERGLPVRQNPRRPTPLNLRRNRLPKQNQRQSLNLRRNEQEITKGPMRNAAMTRRRRSFVLLASSGRTFRSNQQRKPRE